MWNPWSFGTLLLLPVQVVGPGTFTAPFQSNPRTLTARSTLTALFGYFYSIRGLVLLQHQEPPELGPPRFYEERLKTMKLTSLLQGSAAGGVAPYVSVRDNRNAQVQVESQWKHARQTCLQGLGFCFCGFLSLRTTPVDIKKNTYPCGPKSGSQTTSEINVQNDITLKGGIANLERSHRLPRVLQFL